MVLFARVAPASRGRFGEIAMSHWAVTPKSVCVACDENQIFLGGVWIKRLSVEPHCTYTQGFGGQWTQQEREIFFKNV